MNCQETEPLLGAYADGELDLIRSLDVERHVEECAACAAAAESVRTVRRAIASSDVYAAAPPRLVERVRESVGLQKPVVRRPSRRLWSMAMAAAVSLFALGVGWQMVAERSAARTAFAHAVVAAHVRSMMTDHLIDVASSDRHTVKPWFAGRLNFSPEVKDLAGRGFPLIGGRVDYVDDHPAAALSYRAGAHTVALFEWPLGGGTSGVTGAWTDRGYHVRCWTVDRMQFCATSDAQEEALRSFVEAFGSMTAAPATTNQSP